jgi:hypothetical protein
MGNYESIDGTWERQSCGGMIGDDVITPFVTSDVEVWG